MAAVSPPRFLRGSRVLYDNLTYEVTYVGKLLPGMSENGRIYKIVLIKDTVQKSGFRPSRKTEVQVTAPDIRLDTCSG